MRKTVGSSLLRCRAVREPPSPISLDGLLMLWRGYANGSETISRNLRSSQSGSYSAVARCICTWRAVAWVKLKWKPLRSVCMLCGALFWSNSRTVETLTYSIEEMIGHGDISGT